MQQQTNPWIKVLCLILTRVNGSCTKATIRRLMRSVKYDCPVARMNKRMKLREEIRSFRLQNRTKRRVHVQYYLMRASSERGLKISRMPIRSSFLNAPAFAPEGSNRKRNSSVCFEYLYLLSFHYLCLPSKRAIMHRQQTEEDQITSNQSVMSMSYINIIHNRATLIKLRILYTTSD